MWLRTRMVDSGSSAWKTACLSCVWIFFKARKGSLFRSREFPVRPGIASSILRVISSCCGTCPLAPSPRGGLFWLKVYFHGVYDASGASTNVLTKDGTHRRQLAWGFKEMAWDHGHCYATCVSVGYNQLCRWNSTHYCSRVPQKFWQATDR